MYEPPFENAEMNEYFETLPAVVQQTLIQGGYKATSLDKLKSVAENLMNEHK